MDSEHDFTNVQVGDRIVVSGQFGRNIQRVTRVTPKRFEIDYMIFRKTDGQEINGDAWPWKAVRWPTPEIEAEIAERNKRDGLIDDIKKISLGELTTDQLRRIAVIIGEEMGQDK